SWMGGDLEAADSLERRRMWVGGFVMRRFPVTNREYLAFLDDLVAQGRESDALRFAPRERGGTAGDHGAMIYGRNSQGKFELRPDADGDTWPLDYPVFMIDLFSAVAYTQWLAETTGLPWRLPMDLEWEKAARGVDGRRFPWGDRFDPSRCCMASSQEGRMLPAVVDSFPVDESPYGVRGMAGNVRDWCLDAFGSDGPSGDRVTVSPFDAEEAAVEHARWSIRGGRWDGVTNLCRSAGRDGVGPSFRLWSLGFRCVRPL
ncbi:MAG: formylglycine-generating enzyme family protein, partial [Myxococcota bacterium]|nr:formylglycine-generating enzyme family protein [Myxococcota bacterium]